MRLNCTHMPSVKPLTSILICIILWFIVLAQGATRIYYIGIVEENWDYAPTRKNQITGQNLSEDKEANKTMKRGPGRIGQVYKKAIFRQFTDECYSQEIAKPSWLGFLGPVLIAEERDTFIIHLKNFGSWPYSVHPHGVFYKKDSEGALYRDGTSGKSKVDDFVLPGTNYTYTWPVTDDFAPTPADPPCLTWIYHSHIDTPKDISSGLIGPLLVCKKGLLDNTSASVAVHSKGFALMFSIIDENLSWYLDENIITFCLDPSTVDKEGEDFQLSNMMLSINGYMFGNIPGLEMCAGDLVSWFLIGMGSELEVHSVHFFDHTLIDRGYRTDVIGLFPATFITAEMIAENVGKWLLNCQADRHMQGGMAGLYSIKSCGQNIMGHSSWNGQKRKYFIAAERIMWDYGPGGINAFTGQPLNATDSYGHIFVSQSEDMIGSKYKKVVYREHKNEKFMEHKKRTLKEEHLQILGPFIHAEVGDLVVIIFKNKANRPYSVSAHGVQEDAGINAHITMPGEISIYQWRIPERSGPGVSDPNCISWAYYSTVHFVKDLYSGLIGPLVICRKGILNEEGSRSDVDREFILLFFIFDKNESWYLNDNIVSYLGKNPEEFNRTSNFMEGNKMHAINGKIFDNLHGLIMNEGENTNWYLIGMGNEADVHTVHFHGETFIFKVGVNRGCVIFSMLRWATFGLSDIFRAILPKVVGGSRTK